MGKIIEFFWAGTDEIGEICQQKRKGMDYFHDIFFLQMAPENDQEGGCS